MLSRIKAVNRASEEIRHRLERLKENRAMLKAKIYDRYPVSEYGIKAEMVFNSKAEQLDADIALLERYLIGISNMIEIEEGKS